MESSLIEIGETAHALRRAFDRRASALGVTKAQWRVLVKVSRYPGLRQVELADHLEIEPITLCRIIDRLEESGLLERQRDPADRRAWRLHLTEKAGPLIEKLKVIGAALSDEAFAGMTPPEVETLRRGLATIRDNIAALQPPKKASNA